MKYPKRWMRISELVKEGLPERLLYEICHTPNNKVGYRLGRTWRIDTTMLDEELARRNRN